MKKTLSKTEANQEIEKCFKDIKSKTPKQIKKIKRLAMSYNIKLGEKRKLFCKKCFNAYITPKIKVKNKLKTIICENCNYKTRFKLKKTL
ncbi:MAG: hypothetical protein ACE5ES_03275 [Candidatus Nanoarchaeia archaeon]